jgi:hypothetical protein
MPEEKKESPSPELSDLSMGPERQTGAKEDILQLENGVKSPFAKFALWATPNRWIVLVALFALQTLLVALLFEKQNGPNENYFLFVLGILFSHPLLLSFWAAMAPQRFLVRFSWGLTLCSVHFFCIALKCLYIKDFTSCYYISIIDMAVFILALPFLLFARRIFGWRLKNVSVEDVESDYRSSQFGIKHLMILTASTAWALALYKSLIAMSSETYFDSVGAVVHTLALIFFMVLPIVFVVFFTLFQYKNWRSAVVSAICLLFIECAIFYFFPKVRSMGVQAKTIVFFQLGAGSSVVVSGIVLRCCGFRLTRIRRNAV